MEGFWFQTGHLKNVKSWPDIKFSDRIFIGWYRVGKTKVWIIPGTEDLMPYIPKKVLIRKWLGTVIGYPLFAAGIAGLMIWI